MRTPPLFVRGLAALAVLALCSAARAEEPLDLEELRKDEKVLVQLLALTRAAPGQVRELERRGGFGSAEPGRHLGLGFWQSDLTRGGGYVAARVALIADRGGRVVRATLAVKARCEAWRALEARVDLSAWPTAEWDGRSGMPELEGEPPEVRAERERRWAGLRRLHRQCVIAVELVGARYPDRLDRAFANHLGREALSPVPVELAAPFRALADPRYADPLGTMVGFPGTVADTPAAAAALRLLSVGRRDLVEQALVSASPEGRLYALAALRPNLGEESDGPYTETVSRIAALEIPIHTCWSDLCDSSTPATRDDILRLMEALGF